MMAMGASAMGPSRPSTTQCQFCICKVDKVGTMSMEWGILSWSARLEDFLRRVWDTPTFEFADALPRLLKRLESLDGVDKVADRVKTIKDALETELAPEEKAAWACSLCDKDILKLSGLTWTPITSEEDFARILRSAREGNKYLVFIRVREPVQDIMLWNPFLC